MFDTGALAALLSGVQSQQQPAVPPAQPASPLATNLGSILSGDPNFGSIIRQIGGGMANMGPTGGDPFLAFAQGFGGTQQYATTQQKEALARADARAKQKQDADLALQRLTQDQGQFDRRMSQDQSQFDSRMTQDQRQFDTRNELDQAREKREQMIADAAVEKSAAEVKRLAKKEDLDANTMLKIDNAAQEAGKNAYERNPTLSEAEVKDIINAERDRLVQMAKSGRMSDGPGLTEAEETVVGAPKVGDVVDGYAYQGGDPSDPASWKIQ